VNRMLKWVVCSMVVLGSSRSRFRWREPARPRSEDRQVPRRGERQGRLQAHGAKIVRELGLQNAVAAKIPPQALEALQKHSAIEYVENDDPRTPSRRRSPSGSRWSRPTR